MVSWQGSLRSGKAAIVSGPQCCGRGVSQGWQALAVKGRPGKWKSWTPQALLKAATLGFVAYFLWKGAATTGRNQLLSCLPHAPNQGLGTRRPRTEHTGSVQRSLAVAARPSGSVRARLTRRRFLAFLVGAGAVGR